MHADERKVAPLHPLPNPGAVFHHHNQHSPAGYLAYHQSTLHTYAQKCPENAFEFSF